MTRDPSMQYVKIKDKLKMTVHIADVIFENADSVSCVSNQYVSAFSNASSEIVNFSAI